MKSYQVSFFDESQRLASLSRLNDPLVELAKRFDFEIFRPVLTEALHKAERKSPAGRKPLDVILMFKALIIQRLFNHGLNDTTNAFKAYRKIVIDGIRPILSPHFNITFEIPLKAIVRGFSFTMIPITWRNRRTGEAKLKIKEMGSRYLFICLYVWLEKYFSRGDYRVGGKA
jgi:hypothetical protein